VVKGGGVGAILLPYFPMASMISLCPPPGIVNLEPFLAGVVVWTKTAAVEREGAIGCIGRGYAYISKQDFSENLIVAFLLFLELVLVSEAEQGYL
jgi:hypothetical protein